MDAECGLATGCELHDHGRSRHRQSDRPRLAARHAGTKLYVGGRDDILRGACSCGFCAMAAPDAHRADFYRRPEPDGSSHQCGRVPGHDQRQLLVVDQLEYHLPLGGALRGRRCGVQFVRHIIGGGALCSLGQNFWRCDNARLTRLDLARPGRFASLSRGARRPAARRREGVPPAPRARPRSFIPSQRAVVSCQVVEPRGAPWPVGRGPWTRVGQPRGSLERRCWRRDGARSHAGSLALNDRAHVHASERSTLDQNL